MLKFIKPIVIATVLFALPCCAEEENRAPEEGSHDLGFKVIVSINGVFIKIYGDKTWDYVHDINDPAEWFN